MSAARRPYAARLPLEQRREQLMDAALSVLVRDGYAALSVESVAQEAGVTRPVVYSAFSGLGELLFALLDRQQARALQQFFGALPPGLLEEGSAPTGDLADVAAEAARRLIEAAQADPHTWLPIVHAAQAPAEVQERIEGDRVVVRRQVAELVGSEVTADAVLALAEHFGRLVLDPEPRLTPEQIVAWVRTTVSAFVVSSVD